MEGKGGGGGEREREREMRSLCVCRAALGAEMPLQQQDLSICQHDTSLTVTHAGSMGADGKKKNHCVLYEIKQGFSIRISIRITLFN